MKKIELKDKSRNIDSFRTGFYTVYMADTNATFKSVITLTPWYRRKKDAVIENPMSIEQAERDEYLVYRIRVHKDGDGVSAYYGVIEDGPTLGDSLSANYWHFNPRVNDTNLEDDPDRNIKIEDYRRQLDEAEKAKK